MESENRMHIKQIPRIKSTIARIKNGIYILKLTKYHTSEKADVEATSPRHILVKQLDFED